VADLRGDVLAREYVTLDSDHDDATRRRRELVAAVDAALRAAAVDRGQVLSLCVGVPAPVDAEGASPRHPDGFWSRMNPDVRGLFEEWVPHVRVENDASLAAVAEGTEGAGVGCDDYITLLAGERLGAGIVTDGRLLRGAHGGVGEMVAFDHVPGVDGAWGLGFRAAQWAREALADGSLPPSSALRTVDAEAIDGRMVLELAGRADAGALQVVARVGDMLARITGVLGSLFDCRLVIVSGAIAQAAEPVLQASRRSLARFTDLPTPELVASPLGTDVVSIGAVAHAIVAAREHILDRDHAMARA